MSGWIDEIQRNAKQRGERPKVHPHFAVHDHRFMCDGGCVDPHIASQEVFRLRIVGATQHFLNKNVSAPGHGEYPQEHCEHDSDRQEIRRPGFGDLHRNC